MTGADYDDGGGRDFLPNEIEGDGACLFNSAAFLAFGPACSNMDEVLEKALPLRAAVCFTAMAQLERMLSTNEEGGWRDFFCTLHAYDSSVTDKARVTQVPIWTDEAGMPDFFARVFYLYALERITGEYDDAQQFCFPLLAEVLNVNIRCFHPGALAWVVRVRGSG